MLPTLCLLLLFFFLMIRRPPRSTLDRSSAASDVYKRQDYVLSWGPMILGHAAPAVIRTIKKAADNGTSYGAPTELEVILARMIRDAFPSMEKVRLVSSGTEAVMSAIRVARGFTKRDSILKFEGCYHGHSDYLLAKALSLIHISEPTRPY